MRQSSSPAMSLLLATAASDRSGSGSTTSGWFVDPVQTDAIRTPSQSTTTPTTPSAVEMTSDELDSDDSADPMTFQATLSSNPVDPSTQLPHQLEDASFRSVEQPEVVPANRSSFSPLIFQPLHFSTEDMITQDSFPDIDEMSAAGFPPPAPPTLGLPPPPPPPPAPFGGSSHFPAAHSSSGSSLLSALVVPRPRSQMKRLQWTKIPAARVAAGTSNLWTVVARLASAADGNARRQPDFDSLEELFCAQSTAGGGGGIGGINGASGSSMGNLLCIDGNGAGQSTIDRRRKSEEINILDAKRSMNVNIYLRQFAQSVSPGPGVSPVGTGHGQGGGGGYGDVVQWLAEGLSERLGAEKLRGLLKILPEPDDVDRLTNYIDADRSRLGVAERFYIELMMLPNYKLIVETLLIKEEFQTTIDSLKPAIDAIILSARDIKESKALQEIICTVLVAGNFLNSGGYAGEAAGFKLSSLLKLTEIRANKQRMNLMHFVAMETEKRNPRITDQLRQLKYLTEASQYTVDSLLADINGLRDRVTSFHDTMSVVDEQFRLRMSFFIEAADTEMKSLELDKRELEELRLELATYFCEDEKTFKLDDCITTFSVFCQRFIKASEENHERHLLNEQAEQRRRDRERQLTMKKSKSGLSRAFGSSDDLLSATRSEPEIAAVSASTTFSALASRRQSIPERSLYRGGTAHHDSAPTLSADHRRPSRLFQRILSNTSTVDPAAEDGDDAADELVQLLLQSGAEDSPTTCGSPLPRSRGGSLTQQQRQQLRRRASKPCLSADTLNMDRERTPSPRQHLSIEDALRSAATAEIVQGRRRESLMNSTATTQLLRSAASDGRLAKLADNDADETRVKRAQSSEGVLGADVWIDTRVSFDGVADTKRAEHESRRMERRSRSRSKAGSECSSVERNPVTPRGTDRSPRLNVEPSVRIPDERSPIQSTLTGNDAVDVSHSGQKFGGGCCDVSVVLSCDDEVDESPNSSSAAINHTSNPSTTGSVTSPATTNRDHPSDTDGKTETNVPEVDVITDDQVELIPVERLTEDDLKLWKSDRDLKSGHQTMPLNQQLQALYGGSADTIVEPPVGSSPAEANVSRVVVGRQVTRRPSTLPPAVPVDSASTGRPRGSFSSKLPSPTFGYRPIGTRSVVSNCSFTSESSAAASRSTSGKATLPSPTQTKKVGNGKIVVSRSTIDSVGVASADQHQRPRTVSSVVLAALPPRARGRTASAEVESTLSSAQADDNTSVKSSIRQHSTPTTTSKPEPIQSIVDSGQKPKTVDQPSPVPAVTPARRITSASSPPAKSSFKFQIASKSPAASKISVCSAQSPLSSAARPATTRVAAIYSRPSAHKDAAAGALGGTRSGLNATVSGLRARASSCSAHGGITTTLIDAPTKRNEDAAKKGRIGADSRSEEIPAGKVNSRGDLESFDVAAPAVPAQRRGRASSACAAVAKPPLSKGRSLDAPTKRAPDAAAALRRMSACPVQRRASATSSATETGNRIARKPSTGRGRGGTTSSSTENVRKIAGRRE